jgi:hypothetical protein
MTRMTGILQEDQYTILIVFRSVLLRMTNFSDGSPRENQNTHFTFNNFFLKIMSRKFRFSYTMTRTTGILQEDQYRIFILFRSVLLRMRYVSDRSHREKRNTHFMFNNFSPRKLCRLRDSLGKNIVHGRGVRQGCCLSPILLNVYSECLTKEALEGF